MPPFLIPENRRNDDRSPTLFHAMSCAVVQFEFLSRCLLVFNCKTKRLLVFFNFIPNLVLMRFRQHKRTDYECYCGNDYRIDKPRVYVSRPSAGY